MLIFKFNKINEAAFLPHLDSLRAIIRTIRRAEISVKYSEGFNPHMNLYMSPPIPLGIESLSEYCSVDTVIKAEEFMQKFNGNCQKNMECTEAYNVIKNPNMAANITAAKYIIKSGFLAENFDKIKVKDGFNVTSEKNGVVTVKDVKDDIISMEKTEEGITVIFKFGNFGNLRIDRFIDALKVSAGNFPCNIIKAQCYCNDNGKMITADEYIKRFKGNAILIS